MNLVQKLPIGLSLACLMFMSSCSKEDVPKPGSAVTNESSNLRVEGPVFIAFHLPSTDGPTCIGCAPPKWEFKNPGQGATSNLIAYGGHPLQKWLKPLPVPSTGSGSILTLRGDDYTGKAYANIENLVKGKKYKLTFSMSTTILKGATGPYAADAIIFIDNAAEELIAYKHVIFKGKENQWITDTIEFVAEDTTQKLRLDAYPYDAYPYGNNLGFFYTNLHVGKDAVKQIN